MQIRYNNKQGFKVNCLVCVFLDDHALIKIFVAALPLVQNEWTSEVRGRARFVASAGNIHFRLGDVFYDPNSEQTTVNTLKMMS